MSRTSPQVESRMAALAAGGSCSAVRTPWRRQSPSTPPDRSAAPRWLAARAINSVVQPTGAGDSTGGATEGAWFNSGTPDAASSRVTGSRSRAALSTGARLRAVALQEDKISQRRREYGSDRPVRGRSSLRTARSTFDDPEAPATACSGSHRPRDRTRAAPPSLPAAIRSSSAGASTLTRSCTGSMTRARSTDWTARRTERTFDVGGGQRSLRAGDPAERRQIVAGGTRLRPAGGSRNTTPGRSPTFNGRHDPGHRRQPDHRQRTGVSRQRFSADVTIAARTARSPTTNATSHRGGDRPATDDGILPGRCHRLVHRGDAEHRPRRPCQATPPATLVNFGYGSGIYRTTKRPSPAPRALGDPGQSTSPADTARPSSVAGIYSESDSALDVDGYRLVSGNHALILVDAFRAFRPAGAVADRRGRASAPAPRPRRSAEAQDGVTGQEVSRRRRRR